MTIAVISHHGGGRGGGEGRGMRGCGRGGGCVCVGANGGFTAICSSWCLRSLTAAPGTEKYGITWYCILAPDFIFYMFWRRHELPQL